MPAVLMLVFAVTRWPGLMPANFSAAYALAFCGGVYFGKWSAWLWVLTTLLLTDVLLNLHYGAPFHWHQIFNYVGYVGLIGMGRILGANASSLRLLAGSLLGSVFFYLITNTASWFFNPFQNVEYTRDWAGWTIALTQGTANWPETWVFFRSTLVSCGLFTALFVGAMKLAEVPQEKKMPESESSKSPA